jgi:hypothetical protein
MVGERNRRALIYKGSQALKESHPGPCEADCCAARQQLPQAERPGDSGTKGGGCTCVVWSGLQGAPAPRASIGLGLLPQPPWKPLGLK